MLSWPADDALNELVRRYYAGEAGLWETIRLRIDDELRQRQITRGAYHIRFRKQGDGTYMIIIDDAADFAVGSSS
jgi:hypothetical protein